MEAGLEQFGRATCRGVDMLLVVVEPGARSVETASRISELSKEMGVRRVEIVANRVRDESQLRAIEGLLKAHGLRLSASLPECPAISRADLEGKSPFAVPGGEEWILAVRRLSQEITPSSVSVPPESRG
jgi:CO dehydrogenase maturation factor